MPVFIAASGYHYPPDRITNADLEEMVDTSDEWIRKHTGIVERRRAADDVNTSDLGVLATRDALEQAGWRPEDLELLICTTSTPDSHAPATASWICRKLGVDSAIAFDLNAACSGFIYSLAVAEGLMQARGFRRVAVCAADKYTRVTDYTDRANCIFFGDSAGTTLLQPEPPARGLEIVDIVLENQNHGAPLVITPIDGYFSMDGPKVKNVATRGMIECAARVLDRNGVAPGDVAAFMAHQANLKLLEGLAADLGIDANKHWHNVERVGNQSSAGVATSLGEGLRTQGGRLRDGDLLLLTVYGSGLTGGAALLRWLEPVPAAIDGKPQRSSAPTVA
jgi:3-oxoacyl-[acyl-carrier-protein] synthase-3